VFVDIVTELESCHIYKADLLTVKIAARDASRARDARSATKHPMKSNQQHNIAKLDVGLLLLERV
jgi:hypothetical protein